MSDPRIEDLADGVLTKWEDGDDVRSLTVVLAEEIAAAEERGRRAGIEEAARWRAAVLALGHCRHCDGSFRDACVAPSGGCHICAPARLLLAQADIDAALAPRDSVPVTKSLDPDAGCDCGTDNMAHRNFCALLKPRDAVPNLPCATCGKVDGHWIECPHSTPRDLGDRK